jgi:hypothetical protein
MNSVPKIFYHETWRLELLTSSSVSEYLFELEETECWTSSASGRLVTILSSEKTNQDNINH